MRRCNTSIHLNRKYQVGVWCMHSSLPLPHECAVTLTIRQFFGSHPPCLWVTTKYNFFLLFFLIVSTKGSLLWQYWQKWGVAPPISHAQWTGLQVMSQDQWSRQSSSPYSGSLGQCGGSMYTARGLLSEPATFTVVNTLHIHASYSIKHWGT